jgi:hypothetical protein
MLSVVRAGSVVRVVGRHSVHEDQMASIQNRELCERIAHCVCLYWIVGL